MTQLKGLVFDMDGTLVDNLEYHFMSFDEYARRKGLTLLEPMSLKLNGMHSDDVFRTMLGEEQCKKYSLDELNRGKEEVYRDMYRGHIEPLPGIMELLREAKERGVKCAIGSSGCRENVEFIIEGLGIADYIDVSISGSDVTHGKPHPEIFLTAIERMGLKPEECIVVEDAVNGILAGVAAGCKCLAITTTSTDDALINAGATMCAKDFSNITIDTLQQML